MLPTVPPIGSRRFGPTALSIALLTMLAVACSEDALSPDGQPSITRSVVGDVSSFTKTFTPATIGPGSVSELRFDITSAPGGPVGDLDFTDVLPTNVVISTPANASSTCLDGTLSAPDGGGTISYTGGGIGSNKTCSIRVDVTSSVVGTHMNVSGDLTSEAGNHGSAAADLVVDDGRPGFLKSFAPATVQFGSKSTMTLTIDNSANASDVQSLSFQDNLPAGMVVASPPNASTTCGTSPVTPTLTANAGSSVISFSYFGTFAFPAVAGSSTCNVKVDVIGGALGALGNVTSDLVAEPGTVSSGKAAAVLNVTVDALAFSKSFTNDPVSPGGTVNLRFTILNLSRSDGAANIAFTDDLEAVLTGLAPSGALPSDPCGSGSSLSFNSGVLELTNGTLPLEGSCSFDVTLDVPAGSAPGSHTNTTSELTADVGTTSVSVTEANDNLLVSGGPVLTKEFTDNPVVAGGVVTLEFTITNPQSSAMTDITFTDVFDVILPTSPSGAPAAGFCGGSSNATFTPLVNPVGGSTTPAQLVVSDASLAAAGLPGDSCTFSMTLDVALDAPAGTYPNVTQPIFGTVSASAFEGAPASDNLEVVAAPDFQKSFSGSTLPGGTVSLEFSLELSQNSPGDATGISFTDDLDATLSGLAATGTFPQSVCGGSLDTIMGTDAGTIEFTGGTLSPGDDCSFSVDLSVPGTASAGSYTNTTSALTATVDGQGVTAAAATAVLRIYELFLTKEFTDDPILPGDSVTLRFTLDNQGPTAIAAFSFTDDVSEMEPTGLLVSSVSAGSTCGGLSVTGVGTGAITVSGGPLAGNTTCFVEVAVQVPNTAETGDHPNTTSVVNDQATPTPNIIADPADDDLIILVPLTVTKEFTDDPAEPGNPVTLVFTLTNAHPTLPVTDIGFTDDLDATLIGLAATTGGLSQTCVGSFMGTSVLTVTGGTVPAASSCTFTAILDIPSGATHGSYLNTTSSITAKFAEGDIIADPATDDLEVVNAPAEHDAEGPETTDVTASPNPAELGSSVTLTANVDDTNTGGSNIASAEYSVDGGSFSPMTAVDASFDAVSEDVTADISSLTDTTGVFEICVRGTDDGGNVGVVSCIMLAVFDPDGGFVTGGGWIYSEPGSYVDDPDAEGKANFGFVSKYKRGALVPTGNTQFKFKAADLNFHSESYDFLVITGNNRAQFQGSGTINGGLAPNEEEFKFKIWAVDGDPNDPDTFRLRIWWEDLLGLETVVYDNGFDQEIGGGSIVVHTN